jgi:hypothetical protein
MIRQPRPQRFILACVLTLGAGCSKAPAPEFRVINESELKVTVKGGEEIVASAPAAPAAPVETPPAETKSDGDSK